MLAGVGADKRPETSGNIEENQLPRGISGAQVNMKN